MRRSVTVAGLMVVGALALSACGGGGSSPTTTTTTTSPAVQNLTVTPAIRSALLKAGAASHSLPVRDYTGLTKGLTFYAFDPSDQTYWAGAQLIPSKSSMEAEIGAQDDGAYDLFKMPVGSRWTAFNDGLGTVPHSTCSADTPRAIRIVWGWSLTTPCGGPKGI
jgi:hypothetical protein